MTYAKATTENFDFSNDIIGIYYLENKEVYAKFSSETLPNGWIKITEEEFLNNVPEEVLNPIDDMGEETSEWII